MKIGVLPCYLRLNHDYEKKKDIWMRGWAMKTSFKEKQAFFESNETRFYLYSASEWGTWEHQYGGLIHRIVSDPRYHSQDTEAYEEDVTGFKSSYTKEEAIYAMGLFRAFDSIGVTVHGGAKRIADIMRSIDGTAQFPTTALMVRFPDIAQKYINIGIHLGSGQLAMPNFVKFDQALENYVRFERHCGVKNMRNLGQEEAKARIINLVVQGNFDDMLWEYERMMFLFKTLKTLKAILAEKAVEEKNRVFWSHLLASYDSLTRVLTAILDAGN